MGSEQSTRKLTVTNEEVGVIQISHALIQRLAKGTQENVPDTTAPTPVPSSSKTLTLHPQSGEALSGYPVAYYPELTLSALEIQQQKEKELQMQDKYWQERLQKLERNHEKINNILQNEYKRSLDEATSARKSVDTQNTVQPCIECKDKVLKCYQDHPKEILQCSNLVKEFSNCVDQRRTRLIAAR